jgi:hypothetical protein
LSRYPAYRDSAQRTLPRLTTPGTPLFLLIGKDGKVVKTWFGFSKAHSGEFVKAVKAAAK